MRDEMRAAVIELLTNAGNAEWLKPKYGNLDRMVNTLAAGGVDPDSLNLVVDVSDGSARYSITGRRAA